MKLNRREFVATGTVSLATSQGLGSGQGTSSRSTDRLRAGFIGTGGMGRADLRDFLLMDEVEVLAVCDVWDENREAAAEMTKHQEGGRAATYSDFREVLDRKDIDFVVVATPDHWHALPTILACEAGKDVYVEKPLSLTVYEGQRMVEAARKNNRVVQVGTQQRSGRHYQEAVKLIREGVVGKITEVRTWNFDNDSPYGIGNPPDQEPVTGLDWDMYCGPAPLVPFNPNRFVGTFRWFWDYSGGKMTDWGTHHIDIVHWAMDVKGPLSVAAIGRKLALQDNRETPDTLEVIYDYPDFILTFSTRVCNGRDPVGRGYGIEFFGTEGTLFLDRSGFEVHPETGGTREEPSPQYLRQVKQRRQGQPKPWERSWSMRRGRTEYVEGGASEQHISHVRNFLDCVKSRERPISDVEIGHTSTTATHLANISLRVGRRIYWDVDKEQILNDPEASRLLKREYRKPWTL